MYSFPLHEKWECLDECVSLLNEEWSRSTSSRKQNLQMSNDDLPMSIVMVDSLNSHLVIGYSKISKVLDNSCACFVESVIIKKSHRGKGFGRQLMNETENHAKLFGFNISYLTTHDKQHFYEHLGYRYCEPVTTFSISKKLSHNSLFQGKELLKTDKCCTDDITVSYEDEYQSKSQNLPNSSIPEPTPLPKINGQIPAPPPLPKINGQKISNQKRTNDDIKYWMKKEL